MGFYSRFIFSCLIFFGFSCAQRLDMTGEDDSTLIFESTGTSEKNRYLSCSFFTDKTFTGYVREVEDFESKSNCVVLNIFSSPVALLENSDLFLQIYPFFVEDEKFVSGDSVRINTIKKDTKENQNPVVSISNIIDLDLVQSIEKVEKSESNSEQERFFSNYALELCDLGKKWDGLHLVIYERRSSQKDPAIIRKTNLLLPPFLVHPEYYREKKGNTLAALHPFLEYIPDLKSNPSKYYDMAEEFCEISQISL